jgi:hypothetical protein
MGSDVDVWGLSQDDMSAFWEDGARSLSDDSLQLESLFIKHFFLKPNCSNLIDLEPSRFVNFLTLFTVERHSEELLNTSCCKLKFPNEMFFQLHIIDGKESLWDLCAFLSTSYLGTYEFPNPRQCIYPMKPVCISVNKSDVFISSWKHLGYYIYF